MKRLRTVVLISVIVSLLFTVVFDKTSAAPGVPKILSYQGQLLDSSGNPLGGSAGANYCFKFAIYDDATVGSPDTRLWPTNAPSAMTINVKNGVFNVAIGDTSAGGDELNYNFQDNDTIYLNVEVAAQVGGSCSGASFENLAPRQRILASGFAINASTVGGFMPSQSASGSQIPVLSDGNLILGGTNPQITATGTNVLNLGAGETNVAIAGLNCSGYANGGVLTTNATGTIICGDDNTGEASDGITSLNGLITAEQLFASSTSGTDFTISSSGSTHTFNLPSASASARGLLTASDWLIFNAKITTSSLSATAPLVYNNVTGVFSMPTSTSDQSGYLSSADWTTFNSKESVLTFSTGLSRVDNTITNIGVQGLTGSSYLGVSSATGTPTLTNLGVQSLTGSGGVTVSSATGTITLGTSGLQPTISFPMPVASTSLAVTYPLVLATNNLSLSSTGYVSSTAAGTGISVSGSTGAVTITNIGVQSLTGSTYLGVSNSTGTVTLTNLGVQSLTAGTGMSVSSATGTPTITNTRPFVTSTLSGLTDTSFIFSAGAGLTISTSTSPSTITVTNTQPHVTSTINDVTTNTFTFATSSDTNLHIRISTSTNQLTFTPVWTGTLDNTRITSSSYWSGKQDAITLATSTSYLINALTITSSSPTWTFNFPQRLTDISSAATTTGSLLVASTTWKGLTLGSIGQVLTVSSTAPYGISWETVSAPPGSGISTLNGLTETTQSFATSTSGLSFTITSSGSTHTFNFPYRLNQINSLATTTGNLIVGTSTGWSALGVGTPGQVLTSSSTAPLGLSWETASGGTPSLDSITAAVANSAVLDSNANTVNWNWDFQVAGVDSGLNISESQVSINGTQDQQALVKIATLAGSTASPLQITSNSADVGDILINLASLGDFVIQDNGIQAFAVLDSGTVQIGVGSGTATPALIVLDSKNTAGNPTGTNGGLYYNSNENAFRCYRDGVWEDCGQYLNFTNYLSTTTPATPASGNLRVFGRSVGGRMLPAFIGPSGLDSALQPLLARNRIVLWQPAGNAVTITAVGAAALTAVGAATASNVATTNLHQSMKRLDYLVTTAATTAIAGYRSSVAQFWLGNAAGLGGFTMVARWGPATGVSVSTSRAFVGMTSATAAPTDVQPSSLTNMFGMGWDAADANIQFMHNDGSGTATKIDLDSSFPRPTVDRTSVYEVALFAAPNSGVVSYEITDLVSGAVATGSVSTDLPSNTTLLSPRGWTSVGGTSSVIGFALMSLYIETDY